MNLGLRARLFISSLVLVTAAGTVGYLTLGQQLEQGIRQQLRQSQCDTAQHLASAVGHILETHPRGLNSYLSAVQKNTSTRVRIFGRNGQELGGTHPSTGRINPTLKGTLCTYMTLGSSSGSPPVLRTATALPVKNGDSQGWIEVESATKVQDRASDQLRQAVLAATFIALLIVLLANEFAFRRLLTTLRLLLEGAQKLRRGKTERIELEETGELAPLAQSFNRIASDLQRSVERVEDEREKLSALLQSMHEAVVAIDNNDRLVLANHAAREALQLQKAQIQQPLSELSIAEPVLRLIRKCSIDEPRSDDVSLAEDKTWHARATALPSGTGVVLVMFETTELRRLERIRSDFVANVSHELRTPLSVMLANAETLLHGALDNPEQATHFAQAIVRSAKRLSNLLSDLLDLSRVEAGEYKLSDVDNDVRDTVIGALNDVVTLADSKKITFDVETEENLTLVTDATALQQVLTNLISNAVKHAPTHGHVKVSAYSNEEEVVFEVADDGPGIPEQHRQRIFERFYRIDGGRSRDMGGTGLGLSIVKHLVELMNGEVGVRSASDGGALFWVKLKSQKKGDTS